MRQPLVPLACGMAAGICFDRWLAVPAGASWASAATAIVAWWLLWRQGRLRSAGLVLVFAAASTGAMWHHAHWSTCGTDNISRYAVDAGQPVCVEAVAVAHPERLPPPPADPLRALPGGERSRCEVRLQRIRNGAIWQPASGRARLDVDGHLLGVRSGDRLRIFAQIERPSPAMNPGEFDFAEYLRADGVDALLRSNYPDCVERLELGEFSPRRELDRLRAAGDRRLWRTLDHERSGLAAALLLGMRGEVERERIEAFQETGTLHLLAISGMHVGIVAGMLFGALRFGWLPRRAALVGIVIVTLAYALLTDARPPVLRASVLVVICCTAAFFSRPVLSLNALAAAAIVAMLWNPADLFRTGPQLSFLAAATVLAFVGRESREKAMDPLTRLIVESRPWFVRATRRATRWAGELTLLGLCIWLVTLPLVMATYHIVTPLAPLFGVVVWWPVTIALLSGLGVLAVGWLIPMAAAPLGWICDASLWVLNAVVDAGAAFSLSHFWVPGPAAWWLVGFYALFGGWLLLPRWRPPRRWCVALVAMWCTCGLVPRVSGLALQHNPAGDPPPLRVTFLSVGHGSAVLLEFPDGRTLLYDAGRLGSPAGAARTIAGSLWSLGRTHLDAVVLSHADVDHYNAMPELLERISVGAVYVSPVMFEEENSALAALRESLAASETPVAELHGGMRLRTGRDVRIEVLHPPQRGVLGSDNANSIVLAVEYAGKRLLLPGDLETPGLQDVMAEEPWDCDVLLAPHHGSRSSDPPGFAAWSRPEHVVISGGDSFDAAAAVEAYRDRGAHVVHTATAGAVRYELSGETITVSTFRAMPTF